MEVSIQCPVSSLETRDEENAISILFITIDLCPSRSRTENSLFVFGMNSNIDVEIV